MSIMRRVFRIIPLWIVIVGLLFPTVLPAKTFLAEQIDAKAKWAAHFNLQQLWNCELGKIIAKQLNNDDGFKDIKEEIKEILGIRLEKDVHSITVYSSKGMDNPDGVVIIKGNFNIRKLQKKLENCDSINIVSKISYNSRIIYHIEDNPDQAYNCYTQRMGVCLADDRIGSSASCDENSVSGMWVCLYDKSTIIVGSNINSEKNAIDVLTGKRENIADSKTLTEMTKLPAGTIAALAINNISSMMGTVPQAEILKNTKMLAVLIGEQEKNLKLDIKLTAASDEAASQMSQMISGTKAILALGAMDSDPNAAKLLNSITVINKNKNVGITLKYPVSKISDMIKNIDIFDIDVKSDKSTGMIFSTTNNTKAKVKIKKIIITKTNKTDKNDKINQLKKEIKKMEQQISELKESTDSASKKDSLDKIEEQLNQLSRKLNELKNKNSK